MIVLLPLFTGEGYVYCPTLARELREEQTKSGNLQIEVRDLKLQLVEFGKCHERLQEARLEEKDCETSKDLLQKDYNQQQLEIVVLRKENESLHKQLADYYELKLLYDAQQSHCHKEQVDKARLEEWYTILSNMIKIFGVYQLLKIVYHCILLKCGIRAQGREIVLR